MTSLSITPPFRLGNNFSFRQSYCTWLILLLFSPIMNSTIQAQPPCLAATFCMSAPYYDSFENLYAIDVILSDFEDEVASGIILEVNYSNTDFIIDQEKTKESIYAGLLYILGTYEMEFELDDERIDIKGFHLPSTEGPTFTGSSAQVLFTIYYSAAAGECADFTFGLTRLFWVYDPGVAYQICILDVGSGCEPSDVCMDGYTLSGNIESPVLDCNAAYNGGIPFNVVSIVESNGMPGFGCGTLTDAYGDYDCDVVADLDYRVSPDNDSDRLCGITELDFEIYRDLILQTDCLDYLWQLLAGDINESGSISTLDLVALQDAVLSTPVSWPSWTFIPTDQYNTLDPDLCEVDVPEYDRFIDVIGVDDDVTDLDFVGIKMGDANGTCTECDVPFTGGGEVAFRSSPVEIVMEKTGQNEFSFSFDSDISGLEILMFSIPCTEEPQLTYNAFQQTEHFITKFIDGIFYVSYLNLIEGGESFSGRSPILKMIGNFESTSEASPLIPSGLITEYFHSEILLRQIESSSLLVYPNPASNEIIVYSFSGEDSSPCIFTMYDIYGNLILSKPISMRQTSIALDFIPGLYYYKMQSLYNEVSGKLLIQ